MYIGIYSAEAARSCGTCIYRGINGAEIEITAVINLATGKCFEIGGVHSLTTFRGRLTDADAWFTETYKWQDKKCVGIVTSYIR